MRVAFLTHNYPRAAGDLSGAFLETLAAALVRRGTEVTVLAPSDGGTGGDESRAGVRIRRVRYASAAHETIAYRGTVVSALRSPAGILAFRGLWRAMRRAAADELAAGADLIHAHWWVPAGWASPAPARTVLTCHGTDVAILHRSAFARMLARPVFRRTSVVTTVSSAMAQRIAGAVGRPIPGDHIRAMPVETGRYSPGPGGGGVITIGRLNAQKRIDLAIATIAALRDGGRELGLTIVGDGPARMELERLARERGVDHLVRFAGAVAPAEVPAWLMAADVMLFPARGEGFGLAAAEALMCGVPVVACHDGGGVLDVVPEGGAGRRCNPAAAALASATLELLESPDAREQASREGEPWRTLLSPDGVAEACERWYGEALRG